MQIVKPRKLALLTRCIEFRKRKGLCVSAMIYFPLKETTGELPQLGSEVAMWEFVSTRESPPILDVGMMKTRGEFLVHGSVFPPDGKATQCAARVRLGGVEKTLLAFGDRYWEGAGVTAPAPFQSMPLTWARAYGGADFPSNPLGRGRETVEVNQVPVRYLPNFEMPGDRILGPKSQPAPAGFGALDPVWPQRAQYWGTYDDSWLKDHSPGFAPDMNWCYFNVAPSDQWFEKPLNGDERFELENLHPRKRLIAGTLPALKPRIFCNMRVDGGLRLREVSMQMTTVWFFPDAERAVAIFHGLTDIQDEEGADVIHLMGALEALDGAKPREHYAEALALRLEEKKGPLYALRDSDLLPPGMPADDPESEILQKDFAPEGLMADAQRRQAEFKVALIQDYAQKNGIDLTKADLKVPPKEVLPSLEELPDYLAKKTEAAEVARHEFLLKASAALGKAEAIAKQEGIDLEALRPKGPPKYNAMEHLKALVAEVPPGTKDAGGKLLVDYEKLVPQLTQVESAARANYLKTAHLQAPAEALPAAIAAELKVHVRRASASQFSLAHANLTGADLSNLDLRRIDFSNAFMEGANLSGSNLSFANFSGAVLARAQLTDSVAIGTRFTGANLGRAQVEHFVADRADFGGAILTGIDFATTSFSGANLERAEFQEVNFQQADWDQVVARNQVFIGRKFARMRLAGALLGGATFIKCSFEGVDFREADLSSVTFIGCLGIKTSFANANLGGAVFVEACDFSACGFSQARLSSANLRGTKLSGANFSGARFDKADFSESVMVGCGLENACGPEALFIKTDLKEIKAGAIDLKNALLARADLRGADLTRANLYGVDLSRVRVDAATRFDGSLAKRARTYPRLPLDAAPPA